MITQAFGSGMVNEGVRLVKDGNYREAIRSFQKGVEDLGAAMLHTEGGFTEVDEEYTLTTLQLLPSSCSRGQDIETTPFFSRAFLCSFAKKESFVPCSLRDLSVLSAITFFNLGITFQLVHAQTGSDVCRRKAVSYYRILLDFLGPLQLTPQSPLTIAYLAVLANLTGLSLERRDNDVSMQARDFLSVMSWPETGQFDKEMEELFVIGLSLDLKHLAHAPAA